MQSGPFIQPNVPEPIVPALKQLELLLVLSAPEGIIAVDPSTQHTWRPVYIGRIKEDAQFDIVWSSNGSVRPVPYPITRSKTAWSTFVNDLHRRWGGWANTGTPQTKEDPEND